MQSLPQHIMEANLPGYVCVHIHRLLESWISEVFFGSVSVNSGVCPVVSWSRCACCWGTASRRSATLQEEHWWRSLRRWATDTYSTCSKRCSLSWSRVTRYELRIKHTKIYNGTHILAIVSSGCPRQFLYMSMFFSHLCLAHFNFFYVNHKDECATNNTTNDTAQLTSNRNGLAYGVWNDLSQVA